MPRDPWGQFKARTRDVMLAEAKAIELLNEHLADSIEQAAEGGGVLYIEGGQCKTPAPSGATARRRPSSIRQYEPNCGCPTGTTPVGYWHTHPRVTGAGMKLAWDRFEGPGRRHLPRLQAARLHRGGGRTPHLVRLDREAPTPLNGRIRNTKP